MGTNKLKMFPFLIIFITLLTIFSSCEKRRTPIVYELPFGFSGWVTIKYEKKDALPLKEENGVYHIKISPEGFAETSSKVEDGTAVDEYYWMEGDKKIVLEQITGNNKSKIHGGSYTALGYQNFVKLDTLPIGKEITLYDGGKITRLDDKGGVRFNSGRYLLYHFYVSENLEDVTTFDNHLPPLPPNHEVW